MVLRKKFVVVIFRRGDDFGDKELLEFVISAIGVSRDDLVNFYKRYKTELKN